MRRLLRALALTTALFAPAAQAETLSFNGTTSIARVANAAFTTFPATICAWVQPTSLAASGTIAGVFDSAQATTQFFRMGINTTDGAATAIANDGTNSQATGTTTVTVNTWHLYCGTFESATSRQGWVDGTGGVVNSGNRSVTGANRTSLGVRDSSTTALFCACNIAMVAIWTATISAADMITMSLGASPLHFSPHKLVFFAPYVGPGGVVIDWKGHNMTLTSTTTSTSVPTKVMHP